MVADTVAGFGRFVAYVSVAAALIGCERLPPPPGDSRSPDKPVLIALVGPPAGAPERAGIEGGVRQFFRRFPLFRLQAVAPPDGSSDALLETVGQILSGKPRVVCLYVADARAARPAAQQILNSGAALVTLGYESIDGAFGHVQVDLTGGAELLGSRLTEIAGGKRSYILLHRSGASRVATNCYHRFMQQAREQYRLKLLEQRNAHQARRPAPELLKTLFARFRHVGLAVTLDPTPWLSANPEELGGHEARFATLCAAPALWPALRDGQAAALVGPLDGRVGALAAELAVLAATQSEPDGSGRVVACELVTAATLPDFARRYAEQAGLDLDALLPPAPLPTTRPDARPEP